MKYIDADKIRAEIERRKNICEGIFERESDTYYQGKAVAYGELLSFFDTLEEPVSDDLEEEVKRYLCEDCSGDDEPAVSEIARHFAEWQKAKMMEWLEGKVNLSYGVATDAFVEVIDKLKSL